MTEDEKISFLSEKVKEIDRMTREIKGAFPEKSFVTSVRIGTNLTMVQQRKVNAKMTSHTMGIQAMILMEQSFNIVPQTKVTQ